MTLGHESSLQTNTNLIVEDIYDDQLKTAAILSKECGSCLPLLKQELKCKIQAKRLKEGKKELQVDFRQPEKHPLSEREIKRRDERKQINRISARKSRLKRKFELQNLESELQVQQSRNINLTNKVKNLEQAKEKMMDRICQILKQCQVQIPADVLMRVSSKMQTTDADKLCPEY